MLRYTVIWAFWLAQLPLTLAAVAFTNNEYYLHAGSPFTVTWTGNRGPVTLTLTNGPDENLQTVLVIVSNYEGQSYIWTPPAELPADSYILQLEDAGSADYSARFKYPAVISALGGLFPHLLFIALGYYLAYRRHKHQRRLEDGDEQYNGRRGTVSEIINRWLSQIHD
ncbi:hypothetical protein N0V88_007034 [Collariella sp. IMI 366227]|nr:hypothetical protein N0V88_007034 [Collariella sp. IMI 366227]